MLSYRHGFHAGNHADVLKHFVQLQVLRYLNQKDKAWWYIDTHAGAGLYRLDEGYATKLSEWQDGIGRLWERDDLPVGLSDYLEVVRTLNPDGRLRAYPGSPWIALQASREQDRLRLFELHTNESDYLAENMLSGKARTQITAGDGLKGLKALLPPPPRRALVLIDPSYEVRDEYAQVVDTLEDALQRFATGTYAVWYPLLSKPESRRLPDQLKALPAKAWLHVSLSVATPGAVGMHGSGMFVINPPWTLEAELRKIMPWLAGALAQDDGAGFVLESRGD
ncbi:23S rRNA (adenine(2030)-N(6))-methyltransferase RlmJ [Uliginosibacterium sp. H1]|uniref:23S rRNA (adenine(2030)-N(6))-methyltransferase RlmJ n=1 Tax=Uliginosibacterium sp. H1 TaxID=3114757 RepID=UPI002E18B376|nr:23S rRNA (adenine(2030)-N(6))-methyltransferase RlmJ [Uliginosibacterium sp. H1]